MKKNYFILLAMLSVALLSCDPESPEDLSGDNGGLPPVTAPGCFIQEILAPNFNPLYTYHYHPSSPTILLVYKKWNEISGNVSHSYEIDYNEDVQDFVVDTVYHYYGDILDTINYSDFTVYHYTWTDNNPHLDSTQLFVFTGTEDVHKGSTIYTYDNGMLAVEDYFDDPINNYGTIYDEFSVYYTYDQNGQMIRQDWHDLNNVLYYYEEYILSEHYQSNWFVVFNPALASSLIYASQQTTAWYSGTGQYTYEYVYQVNSDNYVVTKDVILQNGDTTAAQLLTYECY